MKITKPKRITGISFILSFIGSGGVHTIQFQRDNDSIFSKQMNFKSLRLFKIFLQFLKILLYYEIDFWLPFFIL